MGSQNEQDRESRREKRQRKRQANDQNSWGETPQVKEKAIKPLFPKTEKQADLIHAINCSSVTFATGPAGTGKTYIAAAVGAEFLKEKTHDLILSRPMIGTEDMGHLPGTLDEKYAPWIEPIIQVLIERLGAGHVRALLKDGRIKAIPLMFMRGYTFNDSYIILDEAQNSTPDQMKMVLTRLGRNSKMVIDGDERQSDLKDRNGNLLGNGLSDALRRLSAVNDISSVEFQRKDIVRHGLIRDILDCYEG